MPPSYSPNSYFSGWMAAPPAGRLLRRLVDCSAGWMAISQADYLFFVAWMAFSPQLIGPTILTLISPDISTTSVRSNIVCQLGLLARDFRIVSSFYLPKQPIRKDHYTDKNEPQKNNNKMKQRKLTL